MKQTCPWKRQRPDVRALLSKLRSMTPSERARLMREIARGAVESISVEEE